MKRAGTELKDLEKRIRNRNFTGVRIFLLRGGYYLFQIFYTLFSWFTSAIMLLLSLPVFTILFLRKVLKRISIFSREEILGIGGAPQRITCFNINGNLVKRLPAFIHIFTGELQLTGRKIAPYEEVNRITPGMNYLLSEKPGIINILFIKKSTGIDHIGDFELEWESHFKRAPLYNFSLVLKSIPALFYSSPPDKEFAGSLNLFGLTTDNIGMSEAVEIISESVSNKKKITAFFVNPDCFNISYRDKEYYCVLKRSDYLFPDGIGITIAGKILKTPLNQNINGTDMLPFICTLSEKSTISIFFLGARPGVAEKMADNLRSRYRDIKIAGTHHGFFNRETESEDVVDIVNRSGADLLMVAFGAPHQEKWINSNRNDLEASVVMGVGGLFDFYSGNIKRAPLWMRDMGIEWIYRLLQEPGRMWKRYIIGNPLFIYRIIKWKYSRRRYG